MALTRDQLAMAIDWLRPGAKYFRYDDYATLCSTWGEKEPPPTEKELEAAYVQWEAEQARLNKPPFAAQLTAAFDDLTEDEQVAFYQVKIAVRDALNDGRINVARKLIEAIPTVMLSPKLVGKKKEILDLFAKAIS